MLLQEVVVLNSFPNNLNLYSLASLQFFFFMEIRTNLTVVFKSISRLKNT